MKSIFFTFVFEQVTSFGDDRPNEIETVVVDSIEVENRMGYEFDDVMSDAVCEASKRFSKQAQESLRAWKAKQDSVSTIGGKIVQVEIHSYPELNIKLKHAYAS